MEKTELIKFLKSTDIFYSLGDPLLKRITETGEIKSFNENEVLFLEGFKGNYFYLLIKGSIKIFRTQHDGREAIIKFVTQGESFAEAVLYGDINYPSSAMALKNSIVFQVNKIDFYNLFDNKEIRDQFIKQILKKLFELTARIQYLSSYDLEERFFKFLTERYNKKTEYIIPIPKKDIAVSIGTVPETFSRLITRLKNQGDIIYWKKDKLKLRNGLWEEIEP